MLIDAADGRTRARLEQSPRHEAGRRVNEQPGAWAWLRAGAGQILCNSSNAEWPV
jgi:hypothetical protein